MMAIAPDMYENGYGGAHGVARGNGMFIQAVMGHCCIHWVTDV